MTDLELIFTMLGERVTTEISQQEKPAGFEENKNGNYSRTLDGCSYFLNSAYTHHKSPEIKYNPHT